jgi:hypothetical protein
MAVTRRGWAGLSLNLIRGKGADERREEAFTAMSRNMKPSWCLVKCCDVSCHVMHSVFVMASLKNCHSSSAR